MNKPIHTTEAYFIKLGSEGGWEEQCLNKNILKVGFKEADHQSLQQGKWDSIFQESFRQSRKQQTVTDFERQIKIFYQCGPEVLWITFYSDRLWWCFSEKQVTLLSDGNKSRNVIGQWRDTDIQGKPLTFDGLSGKLLKVRGYRQSICSIELNLVLRAINAEASPEAQIARRTLNQLKQEIADLVKHLHWKDFELLVDLILTRAGWQRIRELGKTEKTLDLEVISPVLGELAMVQVKSESDKQEFEKYWNHFNQTKSFSRFFYIVHTPDKSLGQIPKNDKLRLLLAEDIAELVINSGLTEWILKKCP